MADNEAAYREFESLWRKTANQQEHIPSVELEDIDTGMSLLSQLQQLSRLADSLDSSDVIDTSQYDQMLTVVENLVEVIEAIDPAVLTETLESLD